jgi:ABC-type polysaccharide/polyol phosphate transport system ATPase subunit
VTGAAVELQSVSKRYWLGEDHAQSLRELASATARRLRHPRQTRERQQLWSLRDIDLEIADGEAVGVIGRNGAGKSTLLKILSRITEPTRGVSRTRGRVSALLEVGTGFHPELTGRENVYLNGAILGMSRRDILRRFDDIIEFAGVEKFVETPVKRYSSGMYLRLAFAVAAHLEPDILVVDEVLAVGDTEFQAKCLRRMETAEREGRTVVFVSHNLEAVNRLCSRGIWLDRGELVMSGDTADVVTAYMGAQTSAGEMWEGLQSGPVRVDAVNITDRDGRVTGTVHRHESVVIEVHYEITARISGFDLAAHLRSARGPEILCEAWADTQPDRLGDPGNYIARLAIPPILNVGDYMVGLWFGDPYETYINETTVKGFSVAGDDENRPNRCVALRLPWQVERVENPSR